MPDQVGHDETFVIAGLLSTSLPTPIGNLFNFFVIAGLTGNLALSRHCRLDRQSLPFGSLKKIIKRIPTTRA